MEENTNAVEAGEINAPKQDETVTPTTEAKDVKVHPKLAEQFAELTASEKETPKEEVISQPTEAKTDAPKKEEQKKDAPIEAQTEEEGGYKPTRLDKRLADKYIRNLYLAGEENIPTPEELMEQLAKTSVEDKVEALHFHLRKFKELSKDPTEPKLDVEDVEAIREEEREKIRREILAEQEEQQAREKEEEEKNFFLGFLEEHKDLVKDSKEFNEPLYNAVNALFRGGMRIDEAYNTVQSQFKAIEKAKIKEEKKKENSAVSGVFSASPGESKSSLTWEDVARIQQEDPEKYRQMVKNNQLPKD